MDAELEKIYRDAGLDPHRKALDDVGEARVRAALDEVMPETGVARAWFDFHMSDPTCCFVTLDLSGADIDARGVSLIDILAWEAHLGRELGFSEDGSYMVRFATKPGLDWCDPERVAGFEAMRELAWEAPAAHPAPDGE